MKFAGGKQWIVERRDDAGNLVFSNPQPKHFFGYGADKGMSENTMAKAIFAHSKDAVLAGDNIPNWPRVLHEQFVARRKTW